MLVLAVSPATLKLSEARSLAWRAMSASDAGTIGVTFELDREESGCAVFHAWRTGKGEPPLQTFTVGWWSVDLRTGEVWDELSSTRVTSQQIESIQRRIRRRLRVQDTEIAPSLANPCYKRYASQ